MKIHPAFFSYAELNIGVFCSDQRMAASISRYYPDFVSQTKSDLDIEINIQIEGKLRQIQSGDPLVRFEGARILFDSPGYRGLFDQGSGKAELYFSSQNPFFELDLFLRIASSLWAIQRGGIQLHCAAIRSNEKAHIFFGHSGSGKTTSARLSRDRTILNDDLNILLPQKEGEWVVHATPFWNPSQVPPKKISAPLGNLFRLKQAGQHARQEMESARALAELISCTPVLKVAPQLMPELSKNLLSMLSQHTCYWLEFSKDPGFWEYVA